MLWYLNRLPGTYEWEQLTQIPGCNCLRNLEDGGTYAFTAPGDYWLVKDQLNRAAKGDWRQVA